MNQSISKSRELVLRYDVEFCEGIGGCNCCMISNTCSDFNMELNLMVDSKNIVEKPLHIYIRSGYDDVTSTDSTVVPQYNQVLPVKVEICDSWEDLSRLLKLNPHQIALHPNTLISAGSSAPYYVSLAELIVLIKTHLKLEKKDIPMALVVEKNTPLHLIKEAQSMGLQGLIPYHMQWPAEDTMAGLDALTNRTTHWPEHIINQLPVQEQKPKSIYFRKDAKKVIANLITSNTALKEVYENVPWEPILCESWDELGTMLKLIPHQIFVHVDMINYTGVTVTEFVSMLETLIKVSTNKEIPIGIAIEKTTPLGLVKEFQKNNIYGILPTVTSFGLEESIRGAEALFNRIPYWPKHIIDQLPGTKKTVIKNTIKLTARQAQIVDLIAGRGLSNKKIAQALNITESTVKIHVSAILKSYGVRTRTQLVVVANK